MELQLLLCTSPAPYSHLLSHNPGGVSRFLNLNASSRFQRTTFSSSISPRYPGLRRATTSEETSSSINEQLQVTEQTTASEVTPKKEEAFQAFEFLDGLNLKELLQLDSESAYPILIYGSGALVALWFASAVVGAIDSIPVFPKLLELVGLAFTIWFASRYLIFKENRDELSTKFEELKQQIIGLTDD